LELLSYANGIGDYGNTRTDATVYAAATRNYVSETVTYTGSFAESTMFMDDHYYEIVPQTSGAESKIDFGASNSYISN
jgi:hypothetical protein